MELSPVTLVLSALAMTLVFGFVGRALAKGTRKAAVWTKEKVNPYSRIRQVALQHVNMRIRSARRQQQESQSAQRYPAAASLLEQAAESVRQEILMPRSYTRKDSRILHVSPNERIQTVVDEMINARLEQLVLESRKWKAS